jgi:hypothetical protein
LVVDGVGGLASILPAFLKPGAEHPQAVGAGGDGSTRGTTMSRSNTRGRWFSLLTTVLTALLVVTFVAPGSASTHPGRGGKHTDQPRVQDEFFPTGARLTTAPITCRWRHNVDAYVCRSNGGSGQQLTTTAGDGFLQAGGGDADYEVANPDRFTCTFDPDPTVMNPDTRPSSWACRYDDVEFRMHEMVMMEDPAEPAPGEQEILYAWPPRFLPHD